MRVAYPYLSLYFQTLLITFYPKFFDIFPKTSSLEHYLQTLEQSDFKSWHKVKQAMKVCIPVQNDTNVYHNNLFRAPHFALFDVDKDANGSVSYHLDKTIDNPFQGNASAEPDSCPNRGICDQEDCTVEHFNEHFSLSHSIKKCDYILADYFCDTMTKALRSEGVKLYKISPFLRDTDIAIKNFILGESLADKLQDIHAKA